MGGKLLSKLGSILPESLYTVNTYSMLAPLRRTTTSYAVVDLSHKLAPGLLDRYEMAYQPLKLAPGTPPRATQLFRNGLDVLLQDVHCLLRLPMPTVGLTAGCNFTIAQTLLSAVSGLAAISYKLGLRDGQAFKALLTDFYPWEAEIDAEGTLSDRIHALWDTFRNPLTHSLGFAFAMTRSGRVFEPKHFDVVINRERRGITEQDLEQFETSEARPHMHPTISVSQDMHFLCVEPLYWGLRQLVYRLSRDADIMRITEQRLIEGMMKRRTAQHMPTETSR